MANLEKLISDHAYWSDARRELKAAGSMRAGMCDGVTRKYNQPSEPHPMLNGGLPSAGWYSGPTCLEKAHLIMLAYLDENQCSYYTYNDAFTGGMDESGEAWEPCDHCIEVRRLKADRAKAGRKLGGIRAAMTRIGRKINEASL